MNMHGDGPTPLEKYLVLVIEEVAGNAQTLSPKTLDAQTMVGHLAVLMPPPFPPEPDVQVG